MKTMNKFKFIAEEQISFFTTFPEHPTLQSVNEIDIKGYAVVRTKNSKTQYWNKGLKEWMSTPHTTFSSVSEAHIELEQVRYWQNRNHANYV